jgi:hypothetical protein
MLCIYPHLNDSKCYCYTSYYPKVTHEQILQQIETALKLQN